MEVMGKGKSLANSTIIECKSISSDAIKEISPNISMSDEVVVKMNYTFKRCKILRGN